MDCRGKQAPHLNVPRPGLQLMSDAGLPPMLRLSPCVGEDLAHTKLLRIQPFRIAIERFLRQGWLMLAASRR